MSGHVLYRMFDEDDALLYVGITLNPSLRFRHHRQTKEWWSDVAKLTLEHFETRAQVEAAERRAIKAENPRWNAVRFNDRRPVHDQPMVSIGSARRSLGKSVEEVAAALEIDAAGVLDIERGESPDLLPAYAKSLGLDPGTISTTYRPRKKASVAA